MTQNETCPASNNSKVYKSEKTYKHPTLGTGFKIIFRNFADDWCELERDRNGIKTKFGNFFYALEEDKDEESKETNSN
jgi:hypothetical protein